MGSVLVTGVSGNLGSEVARQFLEKGDRVAGLARRQPSMITHPNFHFYQADLADEKDARSAILRLISDAGSVEVAVLAAGGFSGGSLSDINDESLTGMLDINFRTAIHTALPVYQHMRKKGYGRIFLVGAKAGLHMSAASGAAAYGFSKSLIFRLAEMLNTDARGSNIVTSVVVPSTIDTPDNRKAMPDADFSKWVSPAAIAGTILYYTNPAADAIREPVIKVYNGA